MFDEENLLMLSGLQHLSFCERQWALIHIEGLWAENRLTVEGKHLHERVDVSATEVRGDLRVARGLRIHSLRLGLIGKADVVEFHRLPSCDEGQGIQTGLRLQGVTGLWRVFPVEYKRGKPKHDPCDEIQLCAQALCLEEMLKTAIPAGALFYGKQKKRYEIAFDDTLRNRTESLANHMQELFRKGATPKAVYESKCENCSLISLCMPKVTGGRTGVGDYLAKSVTTAILESEVP